MPDNYEHEEFADAAQAPAAETPKQKRINFPRVKALLSKEYEYVREAGLVAACVNAARRRLISHGASGNSSCRLT